MPHSLFRACLLLSLASCACPAPTLSETEEPPSTCGDTEDCLNDELCVEDGCVTAYGLNYVVSLLSLSFPETREDGSPWDPTGTGMQATCLMNNVNSGNSTLGGNVPMPVEDSAVNWPESGEVMILDEAVYLSFVCYLDLEGSESSEDLVTACWGDPCGPIPIEVLRGGTTTLETTEGFSLNVVFSPT